MFKIKFSNFYSFCNSLEWGEKWGENFSKNERKIIRLIENDRKITINKIVEATELSSSGVEKIIERLKNKKTLLRVGPAKGGYWRIVMNGRN